MTTWLDDEDMRRLYRKGCPLGSAIIVLDAYEKLREENEKINALVSACDLHIRALNGQREAVYAELAALRVEHAELRGKVETLPDALEEYESKKTNRQAIEEHFK